MPRTVKLEFNKHRLSGFTGNQLKLIACLLMLCDHVGYMLIENGVLYGQNPIYWEQAIATSAGQRWFLAARILRFIGRMAFPLFAFLVAEGFFHSANRRNYFHRLFFFGLLSEVPFDLACRGVVWYPEYQNVLFTYCIAVLCLWILSLLEARRLPFLLNVPVIALFAALAWFLKTDYNAVGVVLVSLFYLLRNEETLRLLTAAAVCVAESISYGGISALSCVLIRFYNGKRGVLRLKYTFYLFYPLHMLLFYFMVWYANR